MASNNINYYKHYMIRIDNRNGDLRSNERKILLIIFTDYF